MTELLRGGAKGDREGALPAAAAVALLTRVPAVAARVVSTEGTVAALVDALRSRGRRDDVPGATTTAGGDDAESHALLAHAAWPSTTCGAPGGGGSLGPRQGSFRASLDWYGLRNDLGKMAAGAASLGAHRRGEEGAATNRAGSWGRSSSRSGRRPRVRGTHRIMPGEPQRRPIVARVTRRRARTVICARRRGGQGRDGTGRQAEEVHPQHFRQPRRGRVNPTNPRNGGFISPDGAFVDRARVRRRQTVGRRPRRAGLRPRIVDQPRRRRRRRRGRHRVDGHGRRGRRRRGCRERPGVVHPAGPSRAAVAVAAVPPRW